MKYQYLISIILLVFSFDVWTMEGNAGEGLDNSFALNLDSDEGASHSCIDSDESIKEELMEEMMFLDPSDDDYDLQLIELLSNAYFEAEVVEGLLKRGANPNHPKCRALYDACVCGALESVSLLLEYGADPNLSASSGKQKIPLMVALKNGHIYIFNELLQHKADPNVKDQKGRTPLIYICQKDFFRRVKNNLLLLNEVSLFHNLKGLKKDAFLRQMEKNCLLFIKSLLKAGVRKDTTYQGKTAFEWAQESGFLVIPEFLQSFTYQVFSLKYFCLKAIRNNQDITRADLDILPNDLKELLESKKN